jgi:hypothetical protein
MHYILYTLTGTRNTSKSNAYRRSHLKVSPNDADVISSRATNKDDDNNNNNNNDCYSKKKQHHVSSSTSTRRSSRKNRVHPAAMLNVEDTNSNSNGGLSSSNGDQQQQQQQRRSSRSYKKKPNLTVDTTTDSDNNNTPSCGNTPSGARGSKDLRSPGMPKTPVVASPSSSSSASAIPDFITQTDASGNATTPRSAQAIEGAARAANTTATRIHPQTTGNNYGNGGGGDDDENDSDSSKDMMTETCVTIADSFRLMCCCLVQSELDDDANNPKSISAKATLDSDENTDNNIVTITQNNNIPRLLGLIHPMDTGKKCLVLDLDETLVHSSFRAVEGADFVIPVQVCCYYYHCYGYCSLNNCILFHSLIYISFHFTSHIISSLFFLALYYRRSKMLFISFMLRSDQVLMNS